MKQIHELLGYKNIKIVQDDDMFSFSVDSMLLADFIKATSKTKKIVDLCCGNAPIPLFLTLKTKASIIGVEIQKDVYDLALESIKINNLGNRIDIINADINELYKELDTESFDIITCNPPFFKVKENSNLNESEYKTIARHEVKLNLEDIMKISRKLLKNNGVLGLVHRPERLVDIIDVMRKNNIEPKKIRLVYPKKDKEANILLIEGTKNGNPGLKILPPLYSHDEDGSYTEEIQKFFENR